jgi:LuxR family maltose regulon positive regulatory protein
MHGEFRMLSRWGQVLPRDVVRQQPHLVLAYAWAHILAEPRQADAVEALLRDAEAARDLRAGRQEHQGAELPVQDRAAAEMRGKLAAIRATIASNQYNIPRTVALAQEALTYVPQDNLFWRIIPTVNLGLALDTAGEISAASQALTEAIDLCRMAGNNYGTLVATIHLARVRATQGQLHAAAELHHRALHLAAEQGWDQLPVVGTLHVLRGKLLYEWNDLPAATQHLLEGLKRLRSDQQRWTRLEGYATLARIKQAQGDTAGALDAMQYAEEVAQTVAAPWSAPLIRTYQTRLWLALGQVDRAVRSLEAAGVRVDGKLVAQRELDYVTLARVQIAQGTPAEALPVLERLREAAEATGRLERRIEILLLQALALEARGDPTQANMVLQRALMLAAPEGYVRVFVDEGAPMAALLARRVSDWGLENGSPGQEVRTYASRLLAVFEAEGIAPQAGLHMPSSDPHGRTPDGEVLTERELQVLRLLAAGRSNQAIADELIIAVGTVKRHINSIFGKLGAQTRLEAATRARDLGLA